MRKQRLFLALLLFLIIVALAAAAYTLTLKTRPPFPEEVPPLTREYPKEVIVPLEEGITPEFSEHFASGSLENMILKSVETGEVVVGDVTYPKAELKATLNWQGTEKKVSATLVDIPADYQSLIPESRLKLTFFYVPLDRQPSPGEVEKLCEAYDTGWCRFAYERGFGKRPIHLPDYLKILFAESDSVEIDNGILMPVGLGTFP